MTNFKFFTTAASITVIGLALASTNGFARGGDGAKHGHSEQVRQTTLERLDSNGDGVLTLDEFSNRNAKNTTRHFNKKDADDDGLLSLEEFSTKGRHRRHPGLDELDAGALELCVEDALGYSLPERPDSATAFAEADSNSDGFVDLEEYLAAGDQRAEQRFADIDSDGDGQLTSEEIDAYQALRWEQKEARRTCIAEQLDEATLLN